MFLSRRSLFFILPLMATLSNCAPDSHLSSVPTYNPAQYRLGTDDEIRVITYQQDQLTADFRIDSAGKIDIPLLGDITVEGLTTSELADHIRLGLREKGILRNADVAVQVTSYRLVSIIGEVAHPGQYAYQPGMTLLSAIAAAGGFTYRSWEDSAYVIRQEDRHVSIGKLLPQSFVKPGDVIKIYERHF